MHVMNFFTLVLLYCSFHFFKDVSSTLFHILCLTKQFIPDIVTSASDEQILRILSYADGPIHLKLQDWAVQLPHPSTVCNDCFV